MARHIPCWLAVAAIGLGVASPSLACVTTGSVYDNGSEYRVGYTADGTLTIKAGDSLSRTSGYLGYNSGCTGVATVSDIGSTWTNSSTLYVGYSGIGNLNIQAGARVSDSTARLGNNSGSTGTATVSGAGSTWDNGSYLSVGYHGAGTLNIEGGGQVSSRVSRLGEASSGIGTVNVVGTGSKWTNVQVDVGASASGSTGALNILDGGQVDSSSGYVGANYPPTSGSATVTGLGSSWTIKRSLYVGQYGTGKLTVADGGLVTAQMLYASPNDLLGNGTIAVNGAVLDGDLVFDSTHGIAQTIPFGSGGALNLNMDGSGGLGAGYKGTGTLRIADGLTVRSSIYTFLGFCSGSIGTATVTGNGSTWISNTLNVGSSGTGKMNVSDGGKAAATGVIVNGASAIRLHVSGNDMLVLGGTATAGMVTNRGAINFYADAMLPAGVYTPISEYAGRTMTWSGTGAYNAWGGTWDNAAKQFWVASATALIAGSSDAVSTAERLLFTDPGSGKRVGASFAAVAAGTNFAADLMTPSEITGLMATPGFSGAVLSGWDFTTNFTGGQAMLSFDIGLGKQDLKVWHLQSGTWTPYTPDLQTYDSHGILSFTASQFSGYAVAGVPEPSTLALLGVAAVLLILSCRRRRA